MTTILAGDIGGTKTLLGLYEHTNSGFNCIYQQKYCSHDFCQFDNLLKSFLEELHTQSGNAARHADVLSLSVAGPVIEQQCRTTNLPWSLSSRELASGFNLRRVLLLNDIEATAIGLVQSPIDACLQINPDARYCPGNRAVISLGTGLGQAFLYWDGHTYHASGTEGGHTDFAPISEEDIPLWHYLNSRFPDHISYERVLSGPGIELLYEFLCEQRGTRPESKATSAQWITNHAINQSDPICIEVMSLFCRLLATEASNLVLKVMGTGGIYFAGGIAPILLPLLQKPGFIEYFTAKGRFSGLLKSVPILVARQSDYPIKGALAKALEAPTRD